MTKLKIIIVLSALAFSASVQQDLGFTAMVLTGMSLMAASALHRDAHARQYAEARAAAMRRHPAGRAL